MNSFHEFCLYLKNKYLYLYDFVCINNKNMVIVSTKEFKNQKKNISTLQKKKKFL